MPTYQYACTECGAQMEVVQSFSDDSLTVCPECEGRLRKVYSAVGIVFKGSGFYRTDSGKNSNGAVLKGSETKDGGKDGGSTPSESTTTSAPAADSGSSSGSSGSGSSDSSGSSGSSGGSASTAKSTAGSTSSASG